MLDEGINAVRQAVRAGPCRAHVRDASPLATQVASGSASDRARHALLEHRRRRTRVWGRAAVIATDRP
jgi:hypothetical protein